MHMAADLADTVFLKQSLFQEPLQISTYILLAHPGSYHHPPTLKEFEDFWIYSSSEQNWGSVSKVKVEDRYWLGSQEVLLPMVHLVTSLTNKAHLIPS